LGELPQLKVAPQYTNIVRFQLADGVKMKPEEVVAKLAEQDIRIGHGGPWGFRAVTHYWIDDAAIEQTLDAFRKLFGD